jgi:hypothetical protein
MKLINIIVMNLRTHSSPSSLSSVNSRSLHENSNESQVALYNSDYFDDIRKQILSIPKINKNQRTMVISFLEVFEDIVEQNNFDVTTIKGVKSNDDEICIYRKSVEGISMIAIDEDGDGFYNFTSYDDGIETIFFENKNLDIQTITYKFFSK